MGNFTDFSGCAGESGCFGASAIAPAGAFPLFATISLTDFLLALGVADKSIFLAGGLAESTLIPDVATASVWGFGASPGDVDSAELVDILAIGVPSGLTKPLGTGSRPAAWKAVNALAVAALAKAGISAVVATAIALGPSAGRCASIAADVSGVDSAALLPASVLPTCV